MRKNYAVILAGGSGTRLWPLSRSLLPKQLLPLKQEQSLLQETAERALKKIPAGHIFTVTKEDHFLEVKRQLGEVESKLTSHILREPEGKNTLPAIAWAVSKIIEEDPGAIVMVFPSDHHIEDESSFLRSLEEAFPVAENGFLVTFGIKQSSPAIGYGYIRAGEKLNGTQAFAVHQFVEKPNRETAERYLKEGNYFWNAGLFCFRADLFWEELKKFQPKIADSVLKIGPKNVQEVYKTLPNLSMDYGIMEKTDRAAVLPASFGWSDLGNWDSFYQIGAKDENQNVTKGSVISHETQSSLLIADKGIIAAIGLENMVVIKTDEAVLVAPRERVEEVKEIVNRLKQNKNSSPP